MSAIDELERQLARAVGAGAAADPARASSAQGVDDAAARGAQGRGRSELRSSAVAGRPRSAGVRRRRRWPHGGRLLAGILVAGLATTGALAATGALRIAPERNEAWLPLRADEGAGVPASELKVLPLRVADPNGGPPWVIRTFHTNRQAACAQVGQLYRGRFGLVERDRNNRPVFRVAGVHIGENARCTNRAVGGFPVLRGLRNVRVTGGPGSPARCGGQPGQRGACPITSVVVVRWGLLGPKARTAQFASPRGPVGPQQKLAASSGGAYLLVQRVDPSPWRDYQAAADGIQDQLDREFPRERAYGSLSPAERKASRQRWMQRNRRAMQLYRQQRTRNRDLFTAMGKSDAVDATFAGGEAFRVAGAGVDQQALPGVPRRPIENLPPRLPAPVRVKFVDRAHAVHVSFPAPVALDRYARYYRVDVRGPRPPACGDWQARAEAYVSRVAAKGDTVLAKVRPPWLAGQGRQGMWCRGATYTVRVNHHSGTSPGGVDRPVGTTSFVAK